MARPVRHADHRRSARAQSEHRLPARLPQAALAEAAGSQGDHYLGDDRRRALLAAFQHGAGDRSLGPSVSGRRALPPGADRGSGRGRRARPLRRDRRRLRRTQPHRPRRHPRLPARRARDPRCRRSATQAHFRARWRANRNPAAVRPPLSRGAVAHLQAAPGSPHRAGDQRRRDFIDRPRHPLRGRYWAGAGQALFVPQQGRAVADREDCAGLGQSARRPLRAGVGRRLHPALRRGGFQQTAAVCRPGNPAFVAGRRHPAHEVVAPGRRRELPVHRSAAAQGDQRRLPAVAGTGRSDGRAGAHLGRAGAGQDAARSARRAHDRRRARRGLS